MNKYNITVKQVARLKNVFIKENRTPIAALQLLKEIDHPEIIDALIDKICLSEGLWHKENAITIGKGNISKLEDAVIKRCFEMIQDGNMSPAYLEAVARTRNFNIEKVQHLIISYNDDSMFTIPERVRVLGMVTRLYGANVELTFNWFNELRDVYPAIKEMVSHEVVSINKILKYRMNKSNPQIHATEDKVLELLDLIKIKQVQDT